MDGSGARGSALPVPSAVGRTSAASGPGARTPFVAGVSKANRRFSPAAILLDIGLPDMDGYDVCRAIRDQPYGQDVRIVAVTGWRTAEDRTRSAEAGFDAHLVKPVNPSMLLQTLSGLLSSSSSGAAQYSA